MVQECRGQTMTTVTLYHFTARQDALRILQSGFRGCVWLSPDARTTSGEASRECLLEVVLRVESNQLEPYKQNVSEDTLNDNGEWTPGSELPPYHWYQVPSTILSAWLCGCRLVTGE